MPLIPSPLSFLLSLHLLLPLASLPFPSLPFPSASPVPEFKNKRPNNAEKADRMKFIASFLCLSRLYLSAVSASAAGEKSEWREKSERRSAVKLRDAAHVLAKLVRF